LWIRWAIFAAIVLAIFCPQIFQRQVFSRALNAPAPAAHAYLPLPWEQLHQGRWETNQPPAMPTAIAALSGRPVAISGYLLPLHGAEEAADLFLAQRPGGCFFCNPPGIADVVLVHVARGKKIPLVSNPVCVYGRFHAATKGGNDESLYEIHDATVVNLTDR
jgi:hypothetical protein